MQPYAQLHIDRFNTNHFLRIFDEKVKEEELVWHRDKRERFIHVLKGKGWKLQFDNELPTELEKGKYYVIPEMDYHRIIKGQGELILEIEEKQEW
jgi:quercetin dioxygenase-like cupin family protein